MTVLIVVLTVFAVLVLAGSAVGESVTTLG